MANHKSAKKYIRSSKRKAQANKRIRSALRTCEKSLRKDLAAKNRESAEKGLNQLFRLADRAKKRGVIKPNTASRKKSRFSAKAHSVFSP